MSAKRGRSTGAEFGSASAHQQLHWLPAKHRVTFMIASLMHQILQKRCPSYLAELVTFNTTYSQRRHLRSSTTTSAAVRRAGAQFGKRAFSVCGPTRTKQSTMDKAATASERQTVTNRKALLHAVTLTSPHISDWLHALPLSGCGLRLDDRSIHIAVGLRLGCQHMRVSPVPLQSAC